MSDAGRTTALVAAVVLVLLPSPASGQGRGDLTVRTGVTLAFGASASLDLDYRLAAPISVFAFLRGLDDGLDCTGSPRMSPCTAAGVSVGAGVRVRSPTIRAVWPYAEVMGGGHRYRNDPWYSMLGLGGGIGWTIGSRVSLEGGVEIRRLGASRLDPLDYSVIGESHRTVTGIAVRVGIRVG